MQCRQRPSLNPRTFQGIKSIFLCLGILAGVMQRSCLGFSPLSTSVLLALFTAIAFHMFCIALLCPSSVQDGALTLAPDKHIALQLCLL